MIDVKNNYTNYNFRLKPLNNGKIAYVTSPSFSGNDTEIKNKYVSFGNDCDVSKAYASYQIDDTKQKVAKIWNEIDNAENIVMLAHKIPDGDAIGSGLALLYVLRDKYPNKNIDFVIPGGCSSKFDGMPGINLIKNDYPTDQNYLAIAVDCAKDNVNGAAIYKNADRSINIDHHITNQNLNGDDDNGDLALIAPVCSSNTEILYDKIFKPLNLSVSKDAAECLLTGLVTDTGNFTHDNINPAAFKMRDELLTILNDNQAFPLKTITNKLSEHETRPSEELNKTFNSALAHRKILIVKNGIKVNYTIVNRKDIQSFKVTDKTPDIYKKISSLAGTMKQFGDIGVVFQNVEGDDDVKVNVSSKKYKMDDLIKSFGGGGNEHSGGFYLNGDENEVISDCLSKIKDYNFVEIKDVGAVTDKPKKGISSDEVRNRETGKPKKVISLDEVRKKEESKPKKVISLDEIRKKETQKEDSVL